MGDVSNVKRTRTADQELLLVLVVRMVSYQPLVLPVPRIARLPRLSLRILLILILFPIPILLILILFPIPILLILTLFLIPILFLILLILFPNLLILHLLLLPLLLMILKKKKVKKKK